MRVALVFPTLSDPAHRRVAAALKIELTRLGHSVWLFPKKKDQARLALKRLLREEKIDVCHVQFFSRGLGFLKNTTVPAHTKVILTDQGACLDFIEKRDAFKAIARRADIVTSVSRAGLKELRAWLPEIRDKSSVVTNGVYLNPPSARTAPKSYILSVGRLAAYKGTDLLILGFAELVSNGFKPDLVLCGPDQTRGRLPRFIGRVGLKKRIHVLGAVAPARINRLLGGCLFFALPSRQENMPMALLEAMAAGKAVVASKVGGVGEIIQDNKNGLLLPPQDIPALVQAMRLLAQDAGLRRRLGHAARARAAKFQWSAVAARYAKLYRLSFAKIPS